MLFCKVFTGLFNEFSKMTHIHKAHLVFTEFKTFFVCQIAQNTPHTYTDFLQPKNRQHIMNSFDYK